MEKVNNTQDNLQVAQDQVTVTLDTPLQRGEQVIKEVTLRRFNVGALSGIRMVALLEMDTDALTNLLPRISEPMLTKFDIKNLSPADFLKLGSESINFLLPKSAI